MADAFSSPGIASTIGLTTTSINPPPTEEKTVAMSSAANLFAMTVGRSPRATSPMTVMPSATVTLARYPILSMKRVLERSMTI